MERFREYVKNLAEAGLSSFYVWGCYLSNPKRWKSVSYERAKFIIMETYHNLKITD